MKKDTMKTINEPITSASDDIKRIIERVLEEEKNKLYQDRPRITNDIVSIIKEEVK